MPAEGRSETWRQFVVTGEMASVSTGGSVTAATGTNCPPYWFSGPSTIILGRSPRPEPDPKTVTEASWDIPVDPDAIASMERSFLVISCIRNFGGLHSLKQGGWSWIWLNDQCLDAFQLMVIAAGHSDYFHRQAVPNLPCSFVFSDYQTKYTWPISRRVFVEGPAQRLRVQIDPEVRWDIDHVAIIISKAADAPSNEAPQVRINVSNYINKGQVGAMGDHWCPVKYFADSSKSKAGKRIVGVHPKNDLN